MDYVVPGPVGTVVYTHMFTGLFNCQPTDKFVGKTLNESGIRRVVVGHQPHGYAPAVVKDEYLEVIDADTSYSDITAKDNRGKAVSEVLIKGKDVFVEGVISSGASIKYQISLNEGQGDPFIGKRVPLPDDKGDNCYWVKAKLEHIPENKKNYLLCKVSGFVVEYAEMSAHDLAKIFAKFSPIRVSNDQPDISTVEIRGKEVPVVKSSSAITTSLREITNTSFFREWVKKLAPEFTVSRIEIQSADVIGLKVRFIKMRAYITDKSGEEVPGVIFLRGKSVSVLVVLRSAHDPKKRFVVVTKHTRAPIGEYSHEEIPVGMDDGGPLGTVRELVENEIGIDADSFHPINMNKAIFGEDKPIYTSPGATDEGMRFYLIELTLSQDHLSAIENKSKSGTILALKLINLDDVTFQCNDAKTILAVHLYSLYKKKQKEKTLNPLKKSLTAMGFVLV